MGMYETIKRLCKERGKNISQLERDLNYSRGSISKIDTHKPSAEKVSRIAQYLSVSTDYLYEGKLTIEDKENLEHLIEVSAGKGRINDCYERVSDSVEVTICGDSMYPVLQDGDVVRVVPATNTVPSDLTVVKINGDECTVKYVELTETGIWLRAENKAVFEDRFYTVQECLTLPVQIIGKAVEITSRIL